MLIYSERMGYQPHSVSLNLSLSLYHSFCLSRSWQLNLAMNFLVLPDKKEPREPVCLCCNSDVSLQTIASHDGCFYALERRESGHHLTHSSLA